jgi:hypothetical protein
MIAALRELDHPLDLRRDDQAWPYADKGDLAARFAPPTAVDTVLSISSVVAGFYGVMLKTMSELHPDCDINLVSKACFRMIGNIKGQEYLAKDDAGNPPLRDARGLVMTLILAIHNASPEYVYAIKMLSPERAIVRLTGKDRYLRIANQLGIADRLEWPTLTPFFLGVADALGINCDINHRTTYTNGIDELDVTYILNYRTADAAV